MDLSDQRRRRKRIFRKSYSSLLSRTILVICFSFLAVLYLLSRASPFTASAYRPVLVVSSLSLLSSTRMGSVKSVQEFYTSSLPLKIESRVWFPDHVLLLVSGGEKDGLMKEESGAGDLECVYNDKPNRIRNESGDFVKKNALSVDEYDGFRSIVRCPLPPVNYSNVVSLKKSGKNGVLGEEKGGLMVNNQAVNSWETVAYAATLDGDTAVVFVKGLNLRPDRESDPSHFTCHFGLMNQRFMLSTKALTAAQEVVRCSLPKSIGENPGGAQGIHVTVGVTPHVLDQAHHKHLLMPSVARISNPGSSKSDRKYELCVCTMVWNQASAIREWIMYHSWLGVERWFIYDNNSDDGIDEVVRELEAENYGVTRHVWPWIKTQEAGFSHCALRAKDECNWVSFMDVDEYYYLPYSTPGHQRFRTLGYASQNSLSTLVANVSSSSSAIAEIRTSCHSFGPSGLSSPPSRGVTMGYTCRLQSPERHKSIVRPDALDATLLNVVHHFHLKEGFRYLNLPQSAAIINHYKYQVWDVFRAKFYRRVATYVADWQENQNEGSKDRAPGLGTEAVEPPDWSHRFCEVWDTGLGDFVLINMADPLTGLLPWELHSASTD